MPEYPVYIDGEKCGEMRIYKDSLMTRISVRCRLDPPRVVRLYAFGGGQSALLGVPEPEGDIMRLERSFTREGLKTLPRRIEYAADRRQSGEDRIWRRASFGCLVSGSAVAIPADARSLKGMEAHLRVIDGKTYLIFE